MLDNINKKYDKILVFDYYSSFDEFMRQKREIINNLSKLVIRFNLQSTLDKYF